jgi:hypothetical protein
MRIHASIPTIAERLSSDLLNPVAELIAMVTADAVNAPAIRFAGLAFT